MAYGLHSCSENCYITSVATVDVCEGLWDRKNMQVCLGSCSRAVKGSTWVLMYVLEAFAANSFCVSADRSHRQKEVYIDCSR